MAIRNLAAELVYFPDAQKCRGADGLNRDGCGSGDLKLDCKREPDSFFQLCLGTALRTILPTGF